MDRILSARWSPFTIRPARLRIHSTTGHTERCALLLAQPPPPLSFVVHGATTRMRLGERMFEVDFSETSWQHGKRGIFFGQSMRVSFMQAIRMFGVRRYHIPTQLASA